MQHIMASVLKPLFTALNYFKHYFCILYMRAHSNSGTFVETKQMHVHNIKIHDA